MLAACIIGPTLDDALFQMNVARPFADLFEIRFDLIKRKNWERVVKNTKLPWIAKGGGEHFQPDYIDVDWDAEVPKTNAHVIRSYHNFEYTPEDLDALLAKMQRYPADIYKIATFASSANDALRLLALMNQHRGQVIAVGLGERGQFSRAIGKALGAPICYASAANNTQAAPGQLSARELALTYRFAKQNRETKLFGLIGDPVKQSVGHLYHNAEFDHKNAIYVKIPLKPNELSHFFPLAREVSFCGLSVTMPLKEAVISFLDEHSDLSVNTITWKGNQKIGHNTDAMGALEVLENDFPETAVILGAGGTAKAIAEALYNKGVKVTMLNRTIEKVEVFAKPFGMAFGTLSDLKNLSYDLLVQATSCGMDGEEMPVDESAILPGCTVLEVITARTPLQRVAEQKGCLVIEGDELFLAQAKKQQMIWSDL